MDYLPIFLAVRNEPCLLVGGSPAAEPKARLLLRAGARLVIVATALTAGLRELTAETGVTWRRRAFRDGDLDGVRLVIVAADDDALARTVASAARRRGIPVNAVDRRSLCSFILPSILDRSRWSRRSRRAAPPPSSPASCARAWRPSSRPGTDGSPGSSARCGLPCSGGSPTRRNGADSSSAWWTARSESRCSRGARTMRAARSSPRSPNTNARTRPVRCTWSEPGPEIPICSRSGPCGSCSRRTSSSTTVWYRRRCSI